MSTGIWPNPLGQFERQEYADWLWRGLRSFYALPARDRVHAFDYVGTLVLQHESLCEGLAHVYERLVPTPTNSGFAKLSEMRYGTTRTARTLQVPPFRTSSIS